MRFAYTYCFIAAVVLGGCAGRLDSALTRAKKSRQPIFVGRLHPTKPDALGATHPVAELFNTSYKTYKYVNLHVKAYNRVGDVILPDDDETPVVTLRFTGPLPPLRTPGNTVWRKITFSDTAVCFQLERIGIEHMDGTKRTLEGPALREVKANHLNRPCPTPL